MGRIWLLNGGLWAVNVLLAGWTFLFAWQNLLAPEKVDTLKGLPIPGNLNWDPPVRPPSTSDEMLLDLFNPVRAGMIGALPPEPSPLNAILTGVFVSEKTPGSGIAFIRHAGRNINLVAYVNETIVLNGKPYGDFLRWKLVLVKRLEAVFSNGIQTTTLKLKDRTADPNTTWKEKSYRSSNFKSRLIVSTDTRQIWGLDRAEIEWAIQNQAALIDSTVRISIHPRGGIKLDNVTPGSMAASRGLRAGDIIKTINGVGINGLRDLQRLADHPSVRGSGRMRITVERAGRPMLLEYRPLPGR